MISKLVSSPKNIGKPRSGNFERLRQVFLGQVTKILRDRYSNHSYVVTDDDAGREDLDILLRFHAVHPSHPSDHVKRAIQVWAPWMSAEEAEMLVSDYTAAKRRLWPSRDDLRTKLRLSSMDRDRLRAFAIPPYDRSDKQLERDRRNKKLARKTRARREAGAVERSIYEAQSLSQIKPWEAQGISRSTWFKRRKKARQVWGQQHAGTKVAPERYSETGPALDSLNIVCPHTCLTQWESQFVERRKARA